MTLGVLPLIFVTAARMAIVVSAEKAVDQPTLRYAARDGERMAQTLRELGNFNHITRLDQPSVQRFMQALEEAETRSKSDPALEVFIYYSGHADEHGLLLGNERLTYPRLRSHLEGSQAAVRVAFLDACHSGNLIRSKGGVPAPGFAIDALPNSRVRGAAIFSASRSDELAQESSAIEGSYFTHHLLSALRGAGDRDGNGIITLGEAYQYAYDRTLASTWPSLLGPQHPSYDYQLSGTGDLVLTHLTNGRQALSFPAGSGPAYVVSSLQGDVIAEVSPHRTRTMRIVLPPGKYRIATREHDRARVSEVALHEQGSDVAIGESQWRDMPIELAFAKGLRAPHHHEIFAHLALSGLGPGALALSPSLGIGYLRRSLHFSFGPTLEYSAMNGNAEGVAYQLSRWKATMFGLRRFPVSIWDIEFGIGFGASYISERYPRHPFTTKTDGKPPIHRQGIAPGATVAMAVELPLVHWLALRLQWGAGVEALWLNEHIQWTPEITSSFALALRR